MRVLGAGFESLLLRMDDAEYLEDKILSALDILWYNAGDDGAHHKAWVIDQMVRALTGIDYENWVVSHNAGEDGPNTYDCEKGVAP